MDPIQGSYQVLTEQMECLICKRLCKHPILKGFIKKYLTLVQYNAHFFLEIQQYLASLVK